MTTVKNRIGSSCQQALDSAKANLLEIENREDLSEDEKVTRVIKIMAATCAGVAVQPIPLADFFVLTPIQCFMGVRIAKIRGIPITEDTVQEALTEIASVVGLGLLAQQLVIGAYKTFIPFLGALTTIPLVFGLTYAIGCVMDAYFIRKRKGQRVDREALIALWNESLIMGKALGKINRVDILHNSKNTAKCDV